MSVRVNCKVDPFNTQIKFPPAWSSWKKSSMGRTKDTQSWRRIEDRVAMASSVDAEEFDQVAIFVQPASVRVDGAPYLCAPLQLDQHGMTTMNAKRRANYYFGLRSISMQDELLCACVAVLSALG
eukprot:1206341-Pyramimonas_sp.AAC.1